MKPMIEQLINAKKYHEVKMLLINMRAIDIAQTLENTNDVDALIVFRLLPKEIASQVFVEFDRDRQEDWIKAFSDIELSKIVSQIFVDDTVDIIEEMPASVVKRILSSCDSQKRQTINEILKYEKDSTGSIMTTEYITLRPDMTVFEAYNKIKNVGKNMESISEFFVTDNFRHLIGSVNIKSLLLSEMSDQIASIMQNNPLFAYTYEEREVVARKLADYDLLLMPICDSENRLVGIVTIDDAVDVLRDETTEDIHLMGAVRPNENTYLKTSPFVHFEKRIVWLFVLMLSGVVTGLIIDSYENVLASVPLLIAFIPRLMGTCGNCGAQSSTLIIRGLAVNEIKPTDVGKIMLKESLVALLVGLSMALINTPILWIMYGGQIPSTQVWWLCFSFGLTLIIVIWIAKIIGGLLPVLAKMLKLDPALMASPIITTLIDIISVTIYFFLVNIIAMPHLV